MHRHQLQYWIYQGWRRIKGAGRRLLGRKPRPALANLKTLRPEMSLHGVDRSSEQIAYLRDLNPGLDARIVELDATHPFPDGMPQVDVAYTQAVIMHIQTGNLHRGALANLFHVARSQVLLMENWARHPFLEDIEALRLGGAIPWPSVHYYYRDSEELGKPHLVICSAEPLHYPVLDDYSRLLEPTTAG
jgi:Methyltransferase domain